MEQKRLFYRCVLLHYFRLNRTVIEAHEMLVQAHGCSAPSITSCLEWFQRFERGNFDLESREQTSEPRRFEDLELEEFFEDNPIQTVRNIARALEVTESTLSKRLTAIELMQKERMRTKK